jgi:hypothetical protein
LSWISYGSSISATLLIACFGMWFLHLTTMAKPFMFINIWEQYILPDILLQTIKCEHINLSFFSMLRTHIYIMTTSQTIKYIVYCINTSTWWGSSPGWVKPKSMKLVFVASVLCMQQWGLWAKTNCLET